MNILIYIILLCVIYYFVNKFILSKFKFPSISALCVFTGPIKSCKTGVSLSCAKKTYKKVHFRWIISCILLKFINIFLSKNKKFSLPEEPLLYSNIKLRNIKYVTLSTEHLLRKKRLNFGSVVFMDEASLIADSQLIKDGVVNTQLLMFFKLFGHETHGGKCIVNTQQISDLHYAIRRCTSQNFVIHHIVKWIPFFLLVKLREERYSDDGQAINVYSEDVEQSLKTVVIRKSIFRYYDFCTFSIFTDNLPVKNDIKKLDKYDSLKTDSLVSFRPDFANLQAFKPEGEKKDESL